MCFLIQPVTMQQLTDKLTSSPVIFLFNFIPVLVAVSVLFFLINNVFYASSITAAVFFSACLINRFKIVNFDDPFVPLDIVNGSSLSTRILGIKNIKYDFVIISVCIIMAILLALAGLFIKFHRIKPIVKTIGVVAALSISIILNSLVYSSDKVFEKLPVQLSKYSSGVFNDLGFVYCFLYNFNTKKIEVPKSYSKQHALEIIKEYTSQKSTVPQVKPHIIMVFNEGFSDISSYRPFIINDKTDPLKNFNRIILMRNTVSGHIIIPENQEDTANMEYDVLTGLQSSNLNSKQLSAFSLVRKNIDSIARLFSENGYVSQLINTEDKWLYNRSNVYKYLGIENQVNKGSFKNPDDFKGNSVSDIATAKMIIRKFNDNLRFKYIKPLFNVTIAAQNNPPYSKDKYNYAVPAVMTTVKLSDQTSDILSTYFEGVRNADAMLARLFNYFYNLDEPVILVFAGSQMPFKGNSSIYKELGLNYADKNSLPFLIWANEAAYEGANLEAAFKKLDLPSDKTINANYLSSVLIELLGYKGQNSYFDYLNDLRREMPVITKSYIITDDGCVTSLSEDQKERVQTLKNWQYFKFKSEVVK